MPFVRSSRVASRLIGGQAVVEGVMMRGPHCWAVAARRPDGTIATTDEIVPEWAQKPKGIPIVRGAFALPMPAPSAFTRHRFPGRAAQAWPRLPAASWRYSFR